MIEHVPDIGVWRRIKGERDTDYLRRLLLELRVTTLNDQSALGPSAASMVRQAIARAARAADPEYVA